MAFHFLNVFNDNNRNAVPFAYADQILYSSVYDAKILYLSAYSYAKNIAILKPAVPVNAYGNGRGTIYVRNSRGTTICYNADTVSKSAYVGKVSRLPNEDAVRIVNYVKREIVETKDGKQPWQCSQYHLVYIPLSVITDQILRNTAWTEERIISELHNPTAQFKNLVLECEDITDEIYKAVRTNISIPFLKEWVGYTMLHSPNGLSLELPKAMYADIFAADNTYALVLRIVESEIQQTISEGLKNKDITINGCSEVSPVSESISSLTEYLASFSNQLIDKAASKFTPFFNPETDSYTDKEKDYFDYVEYFGKMRLYEAQKNVISAVSRSLVHNRSSFIVGECGVGKTALGIGSIYCHAKTPRINTVVLCPGHLTKKWQREITRLYPDARARIIADFQDLLDVSQELTCVLRHYPLFLILSKDTAKIDYTERPSVIYDANVRQFVCPCCGSPIYIRGSGYSHVNRPGVNSRAETDAYVLAPNNAVTLFLEKNSKNEKCVTNHICSRRTNRADNTRLHSCGSTLWTVTNADEKSKWIRHASAGWLNVDLIPQFMRWYENLAPDDTRRNEKLYKRIYTAIVDIQENGVPRPAAPRRYSIARYIREKFNGQIDYLIADECHLYNSGESAQSNAFGDLVATAKHSLALTGTLLNGYADNIYHLLYRMYSREFVKRGHAYNSSKKFVNEYGVYREVTTTSTANGRLVNRTSVKTCPGISPRLFSDMLLNKACFISLADMSDALPSFTETCVPVEMDTATQTGYDTVISQMRSRLSSRDSSDNHQLAFSAIQKLNMYPDAPYDIAPIYSHKTGEVLITFPNAIQKPEDFVSNKDLKVLELARERLEAGDNVLIYTDYVNRGDVVDRMLRMFDAAGIKACNLTASVKPSEREEWIAKHTRDGYRILVTNQQLVSTGLDMLDHRSIIYVSLGYNLFTLRQSSRRSLRLNQTQPVHVYYVYFKNSTQQTVLSLMGEKLRAALNIEGKFESQEGLQSMDNNDASLLTQIANSLVNNVERRIDEGSFSSGIGKAEKVYDSERFTLAQMLNVEEESISYSLLPKVKRTVKLNLRSICA